MSSKNPFSLRVIKSFLYSGIGNTLGKIINVVALFLVLKEISVEAFGIASIVLAIFAVVQAVTELGLGVALVQAEDLTDRKVDSLFWLSLLMTLSLYAIIYFGAPIAATFYNESLLTPLIRVHGLIIVIFTFYLVPRNMLKRDLFFKELAIIDNAALLSSSVVMLVFAYLGFGAWAIILGEVSNRAGQFILSQIYYPYWPKLRFKFSEIKEHVSFGLYATGSRLLYNLYSNADYLIVGRVFGAEAVGIYTFAFRVVTDTVNTLINNVNEVAYPTFAKLQNQIERLRKYFFTIARGSLLLFTLVLIIIAVYIDELLLLGGYGDWIDAVPLIQLFSIVGVLRSVAPLIPQLLNAVGEARLNFYYSLSNAVFMPIAFLIGAQYSLISVGWAWVIAFPLVVSVLFYFGSKMLQISFGGFVKRTFSRIWLVVILLGVAMGLQKIFSMAFGPGSIIMPLAGIIITLVIGLGSIYWLEKETINLLRGKTRV